MKSIKNVNAWANDFSCPVFFSNGASISCGVPIAYLGKKLFVLHKQKTDQAWRIFILDITIEADQYILIHLYNAYNETEQVKILEELQNLLKKLDISQNKSIIFADDFNIFFNSKLEAESGKLLLKKKSTVKLVQIKESLDICNIWSIRNPFTQKFTFR